MYGHHAEAMLVEDHQIVQLRDGRLALIVRRELDRAWAWAGEGEFIPLEPKEVVKVVASAYEACMDFVRRGNNIDLTTPPVSRRLPPPLRGRDTGVTLPPSASRSEGGTEVGG